MTHLRPTRPVALLLLAALVLGGCAGRSAEDPAEEATPTPAAGRSSSTLIVNGVRRNTDGSAVAPGRAPRIRAGAPARVATPAKPRKGIDRSDRERWPEPPRNADGTIDDGPDPFAGVPVQAQSLPIEDDPASTAAIDAWATRLQRVDITQWDRWMDAGLRSPWSQDEDPALGSLVKVTVERCGGAHTVATGVVLADETVVTTVHAIESPARRVRVAAALGSSPRLPAMVRYLDVDDDIAVLKVPGLTVRPMLFHVVTGDEPQWGYAYGVKRGGIGGMLRRTPAVIAMEESSLDLEQPDGFAEEITDRSVLPFVGAVDTGFSGGVVMATNDPDFVSGWGFHGLIRARVPFRAETGGIAVPARLVGDALDANDQLEEWYEHPVGSCPQWLR